ncbi:hypothetical protein SH449x_003993 [Pirellulaceae bacterium SH449]
MNLHALFPYLWLAILVGSYLAAIVVAIMGRPKKPKAPKAGATPDMATLAPEGLDFGDELAQMEKK